MLLPAGLRLTTEIIWDCITDSVIIFSNYKKIPGNCYIKRPGMKFDFLCTR